MTTTNFGPFWSRMNQQSRLRAPDASNLTVPCCAGVHAWYKDGHPIYVGMTHDLRERLVETHLSLAQSMYFSAFRRNVAEHLGFGRPSEIKSRQCSLSPQQLSEAASWIQSCEVAWITCDTRNQAKELEKSLKAEFLPALTKR